MVGHALFCRVSHCPMRTGRVVCEAKGKKPGRWVPRGLAGRCMTGYGTKDQLWAAEDWKVESSLWLLLSTRGSFLSSTLKTSLFCPFKE